MPLATKNTHPYAGSTKTKATNQLWSPGAVADACHTTFADQSTPTRVAQPQTQAKRPYGASLKKSLSTRYSYPNLVCSDRPSSVVNCRMARRTLKKTMY